MMNTAVEMLMTNMIVGVTSISSSHALSVVQPLVKRLQRLVMSTVAYSPVPEDDDEYKPQPEQQQQQDNSALAGLPPAYELPPQPAYNPHYTVAPQQQAYSYPHPSGGPVVIAAPPMNLLPRELQPSDYLVVSIVVALVCGIFNVSSLFFSVPALVCSMTAYERRNNGEYKSAKKLGTAAIICDLLAVTWVVVGGVITVGVLISWNRSID